MIKNNFKADLGKLNEVIANGAIFHAVVTKLGRVNDHDYMSVMIGEENGLSGGYKGRIFIEESDDEMARRTLMPLLGKNLPFVITAVDEETEQVICSRRKAQQILKANMAQKIADQTPMRAEIVKFMSFGAYVDVGGVSGLLRTVDFSDDHSEVNEYYNIGDKISVICTELNEKGRLSFKAVTVHHRSQPIEYDIEEGQVIFGQIRSIRKLERGQVCFVRIDTGLDCLCPMPNEFEIERDLHVAVRINEVQKSEVEGQPPHVRGNITRVL